MGNSPCAFHRAPVGQGPSGPGWLATALGVWSGRVFATGTAWAGLCLIHHQHHEISIIITFPGRWRALAKGTG